MYDGAFLTFGNALQCFWMQYHIPQLFLQTTQNVEIQIMRWLYRYKVEKHGS